MNKTLIIAEVGVNHNGDIKLAAKLIEVAASMKADVVKFQSFKATSITTKKALQANYQFKNTKKAQSQQEMLSNLELSKNQILYLKDCCTKNNIEFLSTAFDEESLEMLNSLHMKRIKIPSGEITNYPFLKRIGSFGKPIILSTGMSNLEEINDAILTLEESGADRNQITILHCTSEYPAPIEDVNLNAIKTIQKKFGTSVGYSDHTQGTFVAVAAVALGAKVIEKHLTLDKLLPGPDHNASLEPNEFESMIKDIRATEIALGTYKKEATPSEIENKNIIRKSIVAAHKIKKGETFTIKNLTAKRPGDGLSPMVWNKIIGKKATRNFNKDDQIFYP